jgi:death-on-curing protein
VVTYLTANEILDINRKFVGPDQLRDFGLLDGAVMRPQASAFGEDAFPTIHEKAAALLHGLARNHPFITGNKRTAWTATAMFYMVNGCNLHVEVVDVLSLTTDAAEGQIGVQDIAANGRTGHSHSQRLTIGWTRRQIFPESAMRIPRITRQMTCKSWNTAKPYCSTPVSGGHLGSFKLSSTRRRSFGTSSMPPGIRRPTKHTRGCVGCVKNCWTWDYSTNFRRSGRSG